MLPTLSSFRGQSVQMPWDQVQQGVRALRQLDGTPGDKNAAPDAITMNTALGQLDAVVLNNGDRSQTVVQRLSMKSGQVRTSWVEVPAKGNGIPNLSGFEVTTSDGQVSAGEKLSVWEQYGTGSLAVFPTRKYTLEPMGLTESLNSLMRAEAVLAAYPPSV